MTQPKSDQPETLLDIVESCTYAHAKGVDRQGGGGPANVQSWEVCVWANGECILTIGHNMLSGRDDIDRYADVVRNAAEHLRSFIGPTRDAAEGAGELFAEVTKVDLADAVKHLRDWMLYIDQYHRQKYADLIEAQAKLIAWFVAAAPPKPVPDAMRFKPRRLWDEDRPGGYLESDNDFIENNREAVIRFLESAAPVPPADGAPVTERQLYEALSKEIFPELLRNHISFADAGAVARFLTTKFEVRFRCPSGTGAAEPVADGTTEKMTFDELTRISEKVDYVEAHADEGGTASAANLQEMVGYLRRLIPAVDDALQGFCDATPPVRGDREAIARLLYNVDPLVINESVILFDQISVGCRELYYRYADAILPVQPGAGELEVDLIWEEVNALGGRPEQNNSYDQGCVDTVGKALEIIEKFGGDDPAPKRALCQPPHSSREGETRG